MDYRHILVTLSLALSSSANAAYATLTPPPGWSAGGGAIVSGSGGSYAATTANAWIANAAKSSAMLNVGGRQLAVPVSMKLAPTAGRVAAFALFASPQLRAAVGIASWLGVAGIVWDAVDSQWRLSGSGSGSSDVSTGFEYKHPLSSVWEKSFSSACLASVPFELQGYPAGYKITGATPFTGPNVDSYCNGNLVGPDGNTVGPTQWNMNKQASNCPAGWYVTPAGCVQNKPLGQPLTQEEMADLLNPDNTPGWPSPTVPGEFPPGTPFPIDLPVVNPSPGANPVPVPYFVPTGQPVPNPQYNPNAPAGPGNQPWKQPGTTVTPQPVPGNPWRVDIAPTDREQAGPNPLPDTEQNPNKDPDTDKPKPEEQIGLCELYPDILACEKLKPGTVEVTPLSKNTVSLTLDKQTGFGPDNGTCPADKTFMIMGKPMAFKWTLLCDFASQIRPLIVGFAYLSAALVFFGFTRKD